MVPLIEFRRLVLVGDAKLMSSRWPVIESSSPIKSLAVPADIKDARQ